MKTVVGKVVVLGHQGVGKTCTVIRYVENTFRLQISPTVGASFFTTKLNVEDKIVKLQIWDTAGQERFKAMAPMFYRNANAALLVFDITSGLSFESMKGWVVELKRNVEEPMIVCVVGNKLDLADDREISRQQAMSYSTSINATYYECSAMTDQGIAKVFEDLALKLAKFSDTNTSQSLRVYDSEDMNQLMAKSSNLEATDMAHVEMVNLSIGSIAHGNPVKSGCC